MLIPIDDMLKLEGINFEIIRDNNKVGNCEGVFTYEKATNRKYIALRLDSGVKENDVLVNSVGEEFYITETGTEFWEKEPSEKKAFYKTKYELTNRQTDNAINTTFNIGTINNSVVGNNNIATINCQDIISDVKSKVESFPEDREEFKQIISLLEEIAEEKLTPRKGLFSKFSSLMEKHSWLTGSIANFVISWLMM